MAFNYPPPSRIPKMDNPLMMIFSYASLGNL